MFHDDCVVVFKGEPLRRLELFFRIKAIVVILENLELHSQSIYEKRKLTWVIKLDIRSCDFFQNLESDLLAIKIYDIVFVSRHYCHYLYNWLNKLWKKLTNHASCSELNQNIQETKKCSQENLAWEHMLILLSILTFINLHGIILVFIHFLDKSL